jgi:hypothetical protein
MEAPTFGSFEQLQQYLESETGWEVTLCGGAHPVQIEGRIPEIDHHFYFRARGNTVSLELSHGVGEPPCTERKIEVPFDVSELDASNAYEAFAAMWNNIVSGYAARQATEAIVEALASAANPN